MRGAAANALIVPSLVQVSIGKTANDIIPFLPFNAIDGDAIDIAKRAWLKVQNTSAAIGSINAGIP